MKKLLYILLLIPFTFFGQGFLAIEQDSPLEFAQGWNMFGFNCFEPKEVIEAFTSIDDKITIVKDNSGNVYMPEYVFNGIGDLERGRGYQIKLTETIIDFQFCPFIVPLVEGCIDSLACNFNTEANMADGTCIYAQQGYDCDGNITEYVVGVQAEGGIIFYIDETGQHGLVAAMEDLIEGATIDSEGNPGYQWGCFATYLSGADGQAIGTGYQNTLDIASGCSETPIAASEALAYESGGYSDWYLPSKDELLEMYNTIGNEGSEGNIGGFSSNWYWSSSESNNYGAYDVNFGDGSTGSFSSKTKIVRVLVIRSF